MHSPVNILKCLLLIGFLLTSSTESRASVYDENLQENEPALLVDAVSELLEAKYVFPDVSKQIRNVLTTKLQEGAYNRFDNAKELAQQFTHDIQSVSHDRHLRVYFDPQRVEQLRAQEFQIIDPELEKKEKLNRRAKNHGFRQVSILDGNVGYIDLRRFDFPEDAKSAAIAAMSFVENTDSLIFDVRNNGGGSPSMVQFLISYLLDEEPVHLNDIYKRELDSIKQYWSLPMVPGKRRPDIDVFVLTSRSSFSAAEDFAYTLKHLQRATIIGETTGGGAHPGGREIANDRFLVWVPTARSINPITGSNWEAVGVKPHIEQDADTALQTAHIMALEAQIAQGRGDNAINEWYLGLIKAKSKRPAIAENLLQQYAGQYGVRTLTYESGELYYQRNGNKKYPLFPINEQLFGLEGKDDFRIKIITENGKVVAIQGVSDDGRYSQNARSSD
ncbi:S41 family peptidase [Alteromonas facilis]|uniref:S41 family peptidase n=1 Tax=Alteromonas facilis TaxID=2048004 RepID=UPI000C294B90|nr:S41 family peptidase [Alteromonas facilis]